VILAAGKSERMGAPKVLQSFLGESFLSRIAAALRAAGVERIVLVLGHQAAQLQTQLPSVVGLQVVTNHDYEAGQFSSLQAGMRALPPQCAGTLLCLIDQPHLFASTYQQILSSARSAPTQVVIPIYNCHRGHPLYLPARLFAEILQANAADSLSRLCSISRLRSIKLRNILAQKPEQITTVAVADPGILEDIDTPADLHRLEQLYPLSP